MNFILLLSCIFGLIAAVSGLTNKTLSPGEQLTYTLDEPGRYCLTVNVFDHQSVKIEISIDNQKIESDKYISFYHCYELQSGQVELISITNVYLLTDVNIEYGLTDADAIWNIIILIVSIVGIILCCAGCACAGCFLFTRRQKKTLTIRTGKNKSVTIDSDNEFDIEMDEA